MKTCAEMVLPGGTVVRHHADDAEVKALAVRLGVYAQITMGLPRNVAHPVSAVLCRDGDTLHAIMLLAGWDDPKDNGWVAVSATPAGPEGAAVLERFVGRVFNGVPNARFEEADQPWPN